MNNRLSRWIALQLSKEGIVALLLTLIIAIAFVIFVFLSSGNIRNISFFPLAIVLFIVISRFELSLAVLVITLFFDIYISVYPLAVVFSLPLAVSFLISKGDFQWKDFSNPLVIPVIIYGLCIIPSFYNVKDPTYSFIELFNVLAFLIVIFCMVAGIRSYEELRNIFVTYIIFSLINSFDVYRLSLSDAQRPFGFTGVFFVDYSALGTCVTLILAIISHGRRRLLFFLIAILITIALILTQTRNTWISAFATLIVMLIYFLVNPELLGTTRKKLIAFMAPASIMIVSVIVIISLVNPRIEKRATELIDDSGFGIDKTGRIENSLGTRVLIWDTAINAFLAHPYIGIGVYSFPYSSKYYYKIPRYLFENFVEESHPHQTHLAVLTETGILGFIGFMYFIISALRCAFKNVRSAKLQKGRDYSLLAAVAVLYSIISMFFTDAWLWGRQIILLGLIFGSMISVKRLNSQLE